MATATVTTTAVTSPSDKTYRWVRIGGVIFIIFIAYVVSSKIRSSTMPERAEVAKPKVMTIDRIREIDVGTEWYRPNTMLVPVRVFGHPMANDVKWRMRHNFDDRTIVHMGSINSPVPQIEEFKSPGPIEYSVEPGQAVTHCTFRFRFDPVQ